jgi:hypothetical protein
MTHDCQGSNFARAMRLVLARLTFDPELRGLVFDELGTCQHCWSEIAYQLAKMRADAMAVGAGAHGIGPEEAKRHCEHLILGALDAAARDRREEQRCATGNRAPLPSHQGTGQRASESTTALGIDTEATP